MEPEQPKRYNGWLLSNSFVKRSMSIFGYGVAGQAIIFAPFLILLLVITIVVAWGAVEEEGTFASLSSCNVRGYTLYGDLVTTSAYATDSSDETDEEEETAYSNYTLSDTIVTGIEESKDDPDIKAIIIEIDSWGGNAVAGEEIANALKRTTKPTVALIRSTGLSAAYWAATGGDVIYASANSDVGSIGAVLSYLDYSKKNSTEGIEYTSITSGKFKDTGSQYKALTAEEKALLQRDIDIIHTNFVKAVSANRNLSEEGVRALADGSTLLGEMALSAGLIDKIGDISAAREYLAEQIGEDVEICWNE